MAATKGAKRTIGKTQPGKPTRVLRVVFRIKPNGALGVISRMEKLDDD